MIKFDCNDGCIHKEVCKHIPAIKKLQREIDSNGYLTEINADVLIKCKNYESRSDTCLSSIRGATYESAKEALDKYE
mgnify:FL=1